MTMSTTPRALALLVGLVATIGFTLAAPAPASACSCMMPDARMLADARAAVVGTVIGVNHPPLGLFGTRSAWTIRVEQDLKSNIGPEVVVRADAEAALGDRFDIKGFHDAVLGSGLVTLPTLDRMIKEWAAA